MATDSAAETNELVKEVHVKISESLHAVENYLTYREQARTAIALSNEWALKARNARSAATDLLTGLEIKDISPESIGTTPETRPS